MYLLSNGPDEVNIFDRGGKNPSCKRKLNKILTWARICKHSRSPGIDSANLWSWRAGTSNVVVVPARQAGNWFLGSLKGLRIRAQFSPPSFILYCGGISGRKISGTVLQKYVHCPPVQSLYIWNYLPACKFPKGRRWYTEQIWRSGVSN